jgi:hypothetical protein
MRDIKVESVKIRWEIDENPDLSWIGEYTDTASDYAIIAVGEHEGKFVNELRDDDRPVRGRDYRYFVAYAGGETPGSPYYMKYAKQDYERMSSLTRGDWIMMGCFAEAEVSRPISGDSRRLQTFRSAGLWGIESDSDEKYRSDVEATELADLSEHLGAFGIEVSTDDLKEKISCTV